MTDKPEEVTAPDRDALAVASDPPSPAPTREGSAVQAAAVRRVLMDLQASSYSGPMPPAEMLRDYEAVLPGSADRVLKMAEEQQGHRIALEDTVVGGDSKRADLGLRLGFIIAMTGLLGGMVLVGSGRSIEGLTLVILQLAALVAGFLKVSHDRAQERIEKSKAMQAPEIPGYGTRGARGQVSEQAIGKAAEPPEVPRVS